MKLDDIDDSQKDALQILLLLAGNHLGKELIDTAQDGIIIGSLHDGKSNIALESRGIEGERLLVTINQCRRRHSSQLLALGLELLRCEELDVIDLGNFGQDGHHEPIPFGRGGAQQVESVREDGTKEHTGDGLGRTAIMRQERMGNDGTHGSPGANTAMIEIV